MKNLMKRGLAVMLAVAMCVSMLSLQAFAATGDACPECHWTGGNHDSSCKYYTGTPGKDEDKKDESEETKKPEDGKTEEQPSTEVKKDEDTKGDPSKPKYCTDGHHVIVNGKCQYCDYVKEKQPENPEKPACSQETHYAYKDCVWQRFGIGYQQLFCNICQKVVLGPNPCTNFQRVTRDDGVYDVCLDCGYERKVEQTTEPDDHEHKYYAVGNEYNDKQHAMICVATEGTCTAKKIWEDHTLIGDEVSGFYCTKCQYKKAGTGVPPCSDGEHKWNSVYTPDGEGYHVQKCGVCGQEQRSKCQQNTLLGEDGKPVAYYCPLCHQQLELKVDYPNSQYCIGGKEHKWVEKGEKLSADGKEVLTTLECTICHSIKISNVCNSPAKVTVSYVYEDGTKAADPKSEPVCKGCTYSVLSPEIPGYEADQKIVSGTSDGKDYDVVVTYEKVTADPTLTVKFEDENGQEIFGRVTKKVKAGEKYSVDAHEPNLGYAPEAAKVEGVMPEGDELRTIKYSPINYTWTIRYVDEDGNEIQKPTVHSYTVNTVKGLPELNTPAIAGYEHDETKGDSRPTADSWDSLASKTTTVYYLKQYTWTITHQFAAGETDTEGVQLPGTTVERFTVKDVKNGTLQSKSFSAVGAFQPSVTTVAAPTEAKDVTVVITYSKAPAPTNPSETETPAPTDPNETENPSTSPNPSAEPSTSPNPSTPVTPNTPEDPEVPVPPENPEEPEVPVPPENPEVPVEDPEIPLVDVPEQDIPLSEEPPEEFRIEDPEIPLGDVPQTGDISLAWYATAFLSTLGLALMGLLDRRKNRES